MTPTETFNSTYREMYAKFFYFACQRVGDAESSKDIVNTLFEYYWGNIGTFGSDDVRPYLWRMLRTKCVDYLRKQQVQKNYIAYTQIITSPLEHDDGASEREERMQRIEAAMQKLTPYARSILTECYLKKKKYKEVADELNVSVSAIHKNIVKALRFIRQEVTREGDQTASQTVNH